jgi:hypothetical protein
VGTGNSYEDDASGNRVRSLLAQTFPLQAAVDILVLLRALTRDDREIATLQSSSPLILLHSTYGGTYAGRISTVVSAAIWAGALNSLTYGGNNRHTHTHTRHHLFIYNSLWSSSPFES